MSLPIPEETFYDELERASAFTDYVKLFRAVLYDYEASPENDLRKDRLVYGVQRAGLSMDRVMREARKRTTGTQGVVEYSLEDVQEIEVLVDALDDPKTRWFVAALLIAGWYHTPRKVPPFIHTRVLELLGVPATFEDGSPASQANAALNRASDYPEQVYPRDMELFVPIQLWVCRDFMFTEEAWARAYDDFMQAWDTRGEEEAE
jgi:hypothetical protein